MNDKKTNTDPKLLAILRGGERMRELIDPEGILRQGVPVRLERNRHNGNWILILDFPQARRLLVKGTQHEDGAPAVTSIETAGRQKTGILRAAGGASLYESIGELNRIPSDIRSMLSRPLEKKPGQQGDTPFSLSEYAALLDAALQWNTEKEEQGREFDLHTVLFETGADGRALRAEFRSHLFLEEGSISVCADADVFGLGARKVLLRKNLGMMRSAEIICTARKDGRNIPSIKAAFDLYRIIPVIYTKQRKEKITKGKPKTK